MTNGRVNMLFHTFSATAKTPDGTIDTFFASVFIHVSCSDERDGVLLWIRDKIMRGGWENNTRRMRNERSGTPIRRRDVSGVDEIRVFYWFENQRDRDYWLYRSSPRGASNLEVRADYLGQRKFGDETVRRATWILLITNAKARHKLSPNIIN